MRSTARWLTLMFLCMAGASRDEVRADVTVGVDLFYDDLAPYGDWFEMQGYGWVWTPRRVASDWRPYTRGRWLFSDADGWLWASDEEWGWATCHYGRWFFDDRYGWVWVPGRDWAPAWVAWRFGGGYVGWAPLPPQARWNAGVGFRAGDVDLDAWITPRQYVFVPERHFVDSRVYRQVISPARNWTVVNVTQNVTNYGVRQNRLVNRSLSLEQVEGHLGRAVPRVRVVEERTTPPRRTEVKEGAVRVFRPAVRSDSAARPRSARASHEVPRVKPHPAEPPVAGAAARGHEPPPTASIRPGQGREQGAYRNVRPGPVDSAPTPDERRVADKRHASQLGGEDAERHLQRDRQREEQRARERSQELQARQDRKQQELRDRQTRQEQQLQQRQRQQQEREARQLQGQKQAQLQREHEEQRLKLQQRHERDHQALQDKQARQRAQLQEKQKKQKKPNAPPS